MKIKLYLTFIVILFSSEILASECVNPAKEIYTLNFETSKEIFISRDKELQLANCILVGNQQYLRKINSITPYSYEGMDGLIATSLQSEREDIITFLNFSNKQLKAIVQNGPNSSLSTWLEITRYMNSSATYMLDFESMGVDPGWAILIRGTLIPLLFDKITITKSMILEERLKQILTKKG